MKARYAIAQAVILIHWVLDWAVLGTSSNGEAYLQAEDAVFLLLGWFVTLYPPLTLPLAVMVGILDGFGDRGDEGLQAVLVVGLAAFVSLLGLGLPELLQGGYVLPVEARVSLLICMEGLLLLEWGIAALIRLGKRKRRANA